MTFKNKIYENALRFIVDIKDFEGPTLYARLHTDAFHFNKASNSDKKKFNKILINLWKKKVITELEDTSTEYENVSSQKEYNKNGFNLSSSQSGSKA